MWVSAEDICIRKGTRTHHWYKKNKQNKTGLTNLKQTNSPKPQINKARLRSVHPHNRDNYLISCKFKKMLLHLGDGVGETHNDKIKKKTEKAVF